MRDVPTEPKADRPGPNLLGSAGLYGCLLFAAGFAFGVGRESVLIPWLGAGIGKTVEFAIMLAVTVIIAARVVYRRESAAGRLRLLMIGILGVVTLLAFESGLALGVLRVPLATYLASFDITKGALFPYGLLLAAFAPLLVRPTACVMPRDASPPCRSR